MPGYKVWFCWLERCALGVVEVDVIVRSSEGDNDKSRSEAIASLVYYYHGGFRIFFVVMYVCVLAPLSYKLPCMGSTCLFCGL